MWVTVAVHTTATEVWMRTAEMRCFLSKLVQLCLPTHYTIALKPYASQAKVSGFCRGKGRYLRLNLRPSRSADGSAPWTAKGRKGGAWILLVRLGGEENEEMLRMAHSV